MEEQNLLDLLNVIAKKQYNNYKISIEPFSTDGANYSSKLYAVKISEENQELCLFTKVAAIGDELRSNSFSNIYETEIEFYTKIFQRYQEIEEKHNVPEDEKLVVPKLYGYRDEYLEEILVFDNLLARGYQMYDRFQTMDWDYASQSLTALARLHGLSMAYSVEYPEEFKEYTEKLKIKEDIDGLRDYLNAAIDNVLQVTKEENKGRLQVFLGTVTSAEYFVSVLKPMKSSVLTHADYRPSNLLHRVQDGKTVHVIPIDFQTLRHGNVISDLVYFIFTGSDKKFRDQYYCKCLDHYYSQLALTLTRLGLEPMKIYPREDFEYELKKASSYGLLAAILCLLIITVDPKDAPKVDENLQQKDFAVRPNERYAERINDVIEDFIKLSVI
ncbi:unnamed protein product [Leptosia nina]|uniref:CHK kinase-like domain-containing protein n=1 Tax=Leptosia nina TaxID=320188 RepID=A0AAV1JP90_9NEOP